jgi:phenylalanyl-tRNA synthetase alpha subunit
MDIRDRIRSRIRDTVDTNEIREKVEDAVKAAKNAVDKDEIEAEIEDAVRASLKNITIRGVDERTYDEFSKTIRLASLSMGEAVTKMMQDVMKDFDDVFPELSAKNLKFLVKKDRIKVSSFGTISISRKDLVDADKRVRFRHIDELVFEDDVTSDLFSTYVDSISHCETVRVPSVLPKLLIYSKISHANNIEIYEVSDEEQ